MYFIFFFQAEDGIRDGHVTGVQTCALPISHDNKTPFRRLKSGFVRSTPAKIRTWNLLIRSQVLYPVKLRAHVCTYAYVVYERSQRYELESVKSSPAVRFFQFRVSAQKKAAPGCSST